MGAFDHLIPADKKSHAEKRGAFDHLVPRKRSASEEVTGFMANLNRSLGLGDEVVAGIKTAGDVATGRVQNRGGGMTGALHGLKESFDANMAEQRAVEDDFAARRPMMASGARGLGMAATAIAPAGAAVQSSNVAMAAARAATAGAAMGYGYGMVDRGDLGERAAAANKGAMVGGVLGGALGAGGQALANRATSRSERAVRGMARRSGQTAEGMRAAADDILGAGFEHPTVVDVVDESGRGVIRAAASRQTPAREGARNFAEQRAMDLPDRISRQARRTMSDDPRAPREIAAELAAQRSANANRNFGAVRSEEVVMAPETVQALRTDHAREAIREAVRRERDPEVRAALARLAADALDDPSTPITVGMADRISRVLNGKGRETRDPDLAATLFSLADDVRRPTAAAQPGYRAALDEFAAESRIMEAADRGEDFLKRNTDEFAAEVAGPGDPGNELARATARRAVERASGENVGSAPGVANRLAYAPEQRMRNAALLGDDAPAFERGMATEARMVQNASDISPRTGSQTQLRSQDAESLAEGVRDVAAVATLEPTQIIGVVVNRLKTLGMTDRDAQALVEIATDPARLNEAIGYLEPRVGRMEAVDILRKLRLVRSVGVGGAAAGGQTIEPGAYVPSYRPMTAAQ